MKYSVPRNSRQKAQRKALLASTRLRISSSQEHPKHGESCKIQGAVKELPISERIHGITVYAAPPEDTTKGAIHNVPASDSDENITRSLVYKRNPAIFQARRMGRTKSAVIVFETDVVSYHIFYRGADIDVTCIRRDARYASLRQPRPPD